MIDLNEVRALAEAARADTTDGLTARERLADVVDGLCDALEGHRAPTRAAITRQLAAAGHPRWGGKHPGERRTPGFRVALNRQITPGGLAVIHMAEFDKPEAVERALESYASTLRDLGYEAQVRTLVGSLRGVCVRRAGRRQKAANDA